jgi:hypothetical protein
MMLKLFLVFFGIISVSTARAEVKDAVHPAKTLEERVAELEANQSLNIFTFNGVFDTRYDNISTPTNRNLDYLRLRFSLDVNANISKNIQFYSRYTTVKFMNRWNEQGTRDTQTSDLNGADDYSKGSGDVVLEKAYVDFTLPDPNFIVSVGRLPTVDGPPTNYWDGRARMGTYPLMTYNSVLDGVAATYKMDGYLPAHHSLAVRAIYTPFSQYYAGNNSQGAYLTPPKNTAGDNLKTLVALYALQVDYCADAVSFANNMNIIVQHFQSNRFNLTGNLDLDVGGTSLMLEANGLAGTGFDLSYSLLNSYLRSTGFATTAGTGFGTTQDQQTMYGQVSLLSTRYRFNDRWFVGLEWVHGSRDFFYYSGAPEDLTGLYGTRGEAYHGYVTFKVEPNLALRLGGSQQDPRFVGPTLGTPTHEGGQRIDTYYVNMRLDF